MNKKQKSIMTAICIYTFVWLMYHITMVTKAYIGMAYPEVSETMLANLVTLPSLTCIIFSFAIGPIALNRSKTKLAISALFTVFLYCVIFYFNGKLVTVLLIIMLPSTLGLLFCCNVVG